MSEMVTLEISEEAAQLARNIAECTGRDYTAVLHNWIDQSASEVPVEALSNEQILALSNMTMTEQKQEELNQLLADQREGKLIPTNKSRLGELMQIYRRGLVSKAHAMNVAIVRGLRPSLS